MELRKVKAGMYVNDQYMLTIEKSGSNLWVVYNIDDSIVCEGRTLEDAQQAASEMFEMDVEDAKAEEKPMTVDSIKAELATLYMSDYTKEPVVVDNGVVTVKLFGRDASWSVEDVINNHTPRCERAVYLESLLHEAKSYLAYGDM